MIVDFDRIKEFNLSWTGISRSCIKYICSNLPSTMDRLNIAGCQDKLVDESMS